MLRALTSSQFSSFVLLKEVEEHKMQHQLLPVLNKILCVSERVSNEILCVTEREKDSQRESERLVKYKS